MKIYILLIFLLNVALLEAQEIKFEFNPITIPSPNAAALGQYGEIPVDYNTGIPNISIPIYNLIDGAISVPISVDYHASGIKPNQYPSWVGQNWTLKAGGMITRNVNNMPDEKIYFYGQTNLGYFYYFNMLSGDDWYLYNNLSTITEKEKDTEPDEFNFNFNGISGKFFLDHTGNWQVLCDQDIKIICTIDDIKEIDYGLPDDSQYYAGITRGKMFFKFVLITEDGTKYTFGNNRNAIEFTRQEKVINDGWTIPVATTWNLTQIESPDHQIVNFEYERGKYDLIYYIHRYINYDYRRYGSEYVTNTSPLYGSSIIEPSYLKYIKSKNIVIELNSSKSNALPNDLSAFPIASYNWESYIKDKYAGYPDIIDGNNHPNAIYSCSIIDLAKIGRKLSQIKIYSGTNIQAPIFKSYNFKYIENNLERLKLDSIIEVKLGEQNVLKYDFNYYSSTISLPGYRTDKIDHWGYFNNTLPQEPTGNYDDFLNNQSLQDQYFISRNPSTDSNVYLTDMLKTITYPTKGTTTFFYEPHDYSSFIRRVPKISNQEIVGIWGLESKDLAVKISSGGLRIKKIVSSSNSGNDIIKEYYYVNDFNYNDSENTISNKLSSGKLNKELAESPDYECFNIYLNCLAQRDLCEEECLRLYHSNETALYNCISNCTECNSSICMNYGISPYIKKGSIMNNSTKIGNFSQFTTNPILPLFDDNGNHINYSKVIEKTNNGYSIYNYSTPNALNPECYDELPLSSWNNSYYSDLSSKRIERNKLISVEVYNKTGVKVKETKNFYNSQADRYNKKIRTRSYSEKSVPTVNGLATDYFGTANYIYYYNSYLEKTVETTYSTSGTNPITNIIEYKYNDLRLLTEKKTYSSDGSVIKTNYRYPNEFSTINTANNYMYYQLHQINAPIEIIKFKNDKVIDATRNDYTLFNGFPRLHKISELGAQEINNYNPITSHLDEICKPVFFFDEYDSMGNVLQYHKNNDFNTSVIWGYNNTYPIVKVENVASSVLNTAFNSALTSSGLSDFSLITDPGSNDLQKSQLKNFIQALKGNPNLSNSLIYIYTYSPLIGITSQTDSKGVTTYYEYDGFGRLKSIKDDDNRKLKLYQYKYAQ